MKALVSIIIPTFNRFALISKTLDSVLDQTYQNWECIVVDDGSIDDTEKLLKEYEENDHRFKFVNRGPDAPKGASACRNIGLGISLGEYIQFLDSDDIISPGKISAQVQLMETGKKNSVITCKWGRFKNDFGDADLYEDLPSYRNFERPLDFFLSLPKSMNFFPIHAYLIRREVVDKAGHWNEYLNFNEDAEFMIRIISNSKKIVFSSEASAYYRLPVDKNVSEYTDIKKVNDGLASWKLIEQYLKIRFGNQSDTFLRKAKGEFFLSLKGFPKIIEEEKVFFRDQIRQSNSKQGFLNRFLNKINLFI